VFLPRWAVQLVRAPSFTELFCILARRADAQVFLPRLHMASILPPEVADAWWPLLQGANSWRRRALSYREPDQWTDDDCIDLLRTLGDHLPLGAATARMYDLAVRTDDEYLLRCLHLGDLDTVADRVAAVRRSTPAENSERLWADDDPAALCAAELDWEALDFLTEDDCSDEDVWRLDRLAERPDVPTVWLAGVARHATFRERERFRLVRRLAAADSDVHDEVWRRWPRTGRDYLPLDALVARASVSMLSTGRVDVRRWLARSFPTPAARALAYTPSFADAPAAVTASAAARASG
jgi:hypothetical protein